ncbi:MAG: YaiI/YqxD family protein [Treponema sp. GWB1_62_6]|nr:MAG: YaiI/YqxD family protein [Treponema sp. GWA1_62_8]OHE63949.1 MAG: YaiI/YqxD family protein [Treponema sp. GWC1_61_84]OHE67242.1 MAG: YaiI/YqxD family protein [Treponema sp. GWB1_62_6]OHE76709.1 MAG: YaiI/YqxD family protein [Treponema sp. RIFOXYC1_FULL_61_9]HCM25272.1 YaiI/YqxD family protein [Treponema sp.]
MMIWVDADSCPRIVRDVVVRAARRTGIPAIFVANRPLPGLGGGPVSFELCPKTDGAADDHIVLKAKPGDLVVTRDVPLAARLVESGVIAVNDRGTVYTSENIRERLSVRDLIVGLANDGIMTERSREYGNKELKAFADGFDRELRRLAKEPK